jgi:hypothetical protein
MNEATLQHLQGAFPSHLATEVWVSLQLVPDATLSPTVSARRNLRFSCWQREYVIIIRAEGASGLTG